MLRAPLLEGARRNPAGLGRRRPSPCPGCPVPEEARRGPGSRGARGLLVEASARAPGHLWPGPSPSWSHLAGAGPASPPAAAGGGVFAKGSRRGAGPAWPSAADLRPGLQGPRGPGRRAAAAAEAGGQPAQGRARGLRAEGTASGGSPQPRQRWPLARRSSRRRSPSRRNCLLPWAFISCFVGAGSSPTALFSSFAFQILLCLAFWPPTFLKAPFPLHSIPTGAEAGQVGDVPMSQIGNLRGRSERAESPSPGLGS